MFEGVQSVWTSNVYRLPVLIPNAFDDQPACQEELTDENGEDHIIEYRIMGAPG
jgi:hypothetical protein